MTSTHSASMIQVGNEIQNTETFKLVQVIERKAFRNGTRIWVRLADGTEHTYCSATNVVINR